jgi:Ca-activated chloride channel family protein
LNASFGKTIACAFLWLAIWAGSAQEQEKSPGKIFITTKLVVLSVTVRDGAGNLVPDLTSEDFRVFDDGVEQTLAVFVKEGQPISFVVLIDNDVNGKEGLEMVRSLRAVLAGISLQDETMVCRFDTVFYPGEGFISDGDKLMAELKSAQSEIRPTPKYVPQPVLPCPASATGPPCLAAPTYAGSRPTKALDDAIFSAAELLHGVNRGRRKVILVISDGVNDPKLNKHDFESVSEKLLGDNISVFSLAVGSDSSKKRFSRLQRYSQISGGDTYYASKSRAMEQLYSRILEEARHQYTLGYVPTGNDAGANYHRVETHVLRDGLIAQTRRGYYSQAPEESK